mgnify:CR=1 FL=1
MKMNIIKSLVINKIQRYRVVNESGDLVSLKFYTSEAGAQSYIDLCVANELRINSRTPAEIEAKRILNLKLAEQDKIDEENRINKYYEDFKKIQNEVGVYGYGVVDGVYIRISNHSGNAMQAELQDKPATDLSFIFSLEENKIGFKGDNAMHCEYFIGNKSVEDAVAFIFSKIKEVKKNNETRLEAKKFQKRLK